jgi:hypothetical protein
MKIGGGNAAGVAPGHFSNLSKDGNGQGMGKVEQYHAHARIFDGHTPLHIPIPTGMKLYPYPYPAGTSTHWVPTGISNTTHFTIVLLSIVHWGLEHAILISLIWGDMWIMCNA